MAGSSFFLGIGCIVGTGIFVLTGNRCRAACRTGDCDLICGLRTGGVYAQLFATQRVFRRCCLVTGSAYTYAYATLGEFIAWIIGWDLILEYLLRRLHRWTVWMVQVTSLNCSATTESIFRPAFSQAPLGLCSRSFGDNWVLSLMCRRYLSSRLLRLVSRAGDPRIGGR